MFDPFRSNRPLCGFPKKKTSTREPPHPVFPPVKTRVHTTSRARAPFRFEVFGSLRRCRRERPTTETIATCDETVTVRFAYQPLPPNHTPRSTPGSGRSVTDSRRRKIIVGRSRVVISSSGRESIGKQTDKSRPAASIFRARRDDNRRKHLDEHVPRRLYAEITSRDKTHSP